MRFRALVLVISFIIAASVSSFGAGKRVVRVSGIVDRVTYGAIGRVDGVILQDRTFVRFRPESLQDTSALAPGDSITARGTLVRSSPNRVLDRVVLSKGGTELIDDLPQSSEAAPPPSLGSAAAPVPLQMIVMRDTSSVLAVGATSSGEIDRFILSNGVTVEIPATAHIDAAALAPGQRLSVFGTAPSLGGGRFLAALSISSVKPGQSPAEPQPQLLRARSHLGETWQVAKGIIRQPLLNPQGDVNGVLLASGTTVHFPPISERDAAALAPNTLVEAAGPSKGNQIRTNILILPSEHLVIGTAPPLRQARQLLQRGPASSSSALSLIIETAQIKSVLLDLNGSAQTLVLSDGTVAELSPQTQISGGNSLSNGQTVTVRGLGGRYPMGTALAAQMVQIAQ